MEGTRYTNASTLEFSYPWETNFDMTEPTKFMKDNWKISIYSSILYIILTSLGQRWMKNQKPYQLTGILFLWNAFLAIFSLAITIRGGVFAAFALKHYGFEKAVCECTDCDSHPVQAFWRYWYTMSKIFELGDTFFVIVRKQPLLFLHRYHHVTVLIFTWFSMSQNTSTSNIFGYINCIVHTLMYSYFALRTIKIRLPTAFRMFITGVQISQMVIGCFANYTAYRVLAEGRPCQVSPENMKFAVALYISYLILFTNFFIDSYIKGVSLSSYWQNTRENVKKED